MVEFGFRATSDPVEFILGNSWIEPADVQRDYQWGEAEVSALWDDLKTFVFDPTGESSPVYFLGMIIVHGGEARYAIYDGLQRVTTLTILLALLRDYVEDEALSRRLGACVLDMRGQPRLRLMGHQYLADHIQPVGAARTLRGGRLSGQADALRRAQGLLRDEVKGLTQEQRQAMARVLLERVVMLRLSVDSRPMANRVFQTINMRGLKLEDADLIKSRLSEFPGTPEEIDGLLEKWQTIRQVLSSKSQERVEQVEESYKFDRYSGFQGFVLALEMMERGIADRRERKLEPVERLDGYVEWMKARNANAGALTRYFAFVYRCAENWNLLNQPALGGANGYFQALLPIRAVWWTEWKPLVLRIMGLASQMGPRDGAAWRRGLFDQIHRAAIAMELSGFSAQKRHLVFAKALAEFAGAQRPGQLRALRMRDEDVVRIHRTLSAPLTNYTLRRSLILWTEYMLSAPEFTLIRNASVEHVLPQSTNLPEPWLAAFPDAKKREQMLHMLGNLILLPTEINLAISDNSFEEKTAFLRQRANALQGYHLVDWVLARDDWTPSHIHTRTHEVATFIWKELDVSELTYREYGEQRA